MADLVEFIATRQGFYGSKRIDTGETFVASAKEKFGWAVPSETAGKKSKAGGEAGEGLLDKSPAEIKAALSTKTQSELAQLHVEETASTGKNRKVVVAALQDAIANAQIPNPPASSGGLDPSHPTIPAGGKPTPSDKKNDPLA